MVSNKTARRREAGHVWKNRVRKVRQRNRERSRRDGKVEIAVQ